MAGMAVAWGTKAAMVPAAGGSRSSNVGRAAGAAAAGAAIVGLGRMSLGRQQLHGMVVASPSEAKRVLTIAALKTEETELVELTPEQATGASSELQLAAEDLLKKAQETWAKVDDKLAIGSLAGVALIVLWGSSGLLSSIDKLPLIPQFLELVGLLYTGWFIYRYLLFKPDREELLKVVDETKSKITGQEDL